MAAHRVNLKKKHEEILSYTGETELPGKVNAVVLDVMMEISSAGKTLSVTVIEP